MGGCEERERWGGVRGGGGGRGVRRGEGGCEGRERWEGVRGGGGGDVRGGGGGGV